MRSHCAQYVLAVAALKGKLEPEDVLIKDHRSDARVQRLFKNITVVADETLAPSYPEQYISIVEVTTKDGSLYKKQISCARGLPDNPMEREELIEKFMSLSTTVMPSKQAT